MDAPNNRQEGHLVHGQGSEIVLKDLRANVTLKLEDFVKVFKEVIGGD
jgi:uncharacterized protein YehS (DUF1456 family)